jgi:glutaconate CoA-transferase, subunit A
MALKDRAARVKDGAVVADGGGLSSREPMALLRAILRRGVNFMADPVGGAS